MADGLTVGQHVIAVLLLIVAGCAVGLNLLDQPVKIAFKQPVHGSDLNSFSTMNILGTVAACRLRQAIP
jgi:hypothetical protein